MKEIGGYIELDKQYGSIYHDNAIALNCGRAALRYIIRAKGIKKIFIPYFGCNTVAAACQKENINYEYYRINDKFRPEFSKHLYDDEWLYIINYYGQISNDEVCQWKEKYKNLIFDNAQAYFQMPVNGVDTIYTCRKFFGVPDGAFLYSDKSLYDLERDESFDRIRFVLGRFERNAGEFYTQASNNNDLFDLEPIKHMSKLTENLLRAIDYNLSEKKRTDNFSYLHKQLKDINKLDLSVPKGAFMYPLLIENATKIRKILVSEKIYIPILWPDVFDICNEESLEYRYAKNILPIPVDQRYGIDDMEYICFKLEESMKNWLFRGDRG